MKTRLNFNSPKEMICWLIDNEGIILFDFYGRKWMYLTFTFNFSDLGEKEFYAGVIECLHLYGEGFYYLKN